MAPGGARYVNHLEGSVVRLAQKLVGVVRCGVWIVVVLRCVPAVTCTHVHSSAHIEMTNAFSHELCM
jgi:hypothetical protein